MIPETAKSELVKKRLAGANWTELSQFLQREYGIDIHRTTVMRWYDREVSLENINPDNIVLDSLDDRLKLDKKLATFKAESTYYKKLYETSLKDTAKQNLLVEAIQKFTPYFEKVPINKIPKPSGKQKGDSAQTVVAPLCDTHIGEHVDYQQMAGLNSYDFDIFNKR